MSSITQTSAQLHNQSSSPADPTKDGNAYSSGGANTDNDTDKYEYIEPETGNCRVRKGVSVDEYVYAGVVEPGRTAPVKTDFVENDVYIGGDEKLQKIEINGQNGFNISMEENHVYEGGDINAEYDVYLGSASANQNQRIPAATEDDNHYDFYSGTQSVGLANRAVSDNDVIMTENDIYTQQ